MLVEEVQIHLRETQLGVEAQRALQIFRRDHLARGLRKGLAECGEILLSHRQPGGHLVSAEFFQQRCAARERGDE